MNHGICQRTKNLMLADHYSRDVFVNGGLDGHLYLIISSLSFETRFLIKTLL